MEDCKMYIKSISFNDDTKIKLNDDDIVVFVGTNNAGKTTILNNIYSYLEENKIRNEKIIKELETYKENTENYNKTIDKYCNKSLDGLYYYSYKFSELALIHGSYSFDRDFFVNKIDTTTRLTGCYPVEKMDLGDKISDPINMLHLDDDLFKIVSGYFYKVFGEYLYIDSLNYNKLYLKKGIMHNEKIDKVNAINEIKKDFNNMDNIFEQGDGIKSFVSLLINLIYPRYSINIIDEPEAFLHQPQAYITGVAIAELTSKQQVFISTHSSDVLKGLINTCGQRLKIIRVSRTHNYNNIEMISNEDVELLMSDPLLQYSNMFDSIFNQRVVLCEGDADCQFYKTILMHEKVKRGSYCTDYFVSVHGKDKMYKMVEILKKLGVDVVTIVDIDILNDKSNFKRLSDSHGIDWRLIEKSYDIIYKTINNKAIKRTVLSLQSELKKYLSEYEADELVDANIKRGLTDLLKDKNPWDVIKKYGVNGFPAGDCKEHFNKINSQLKERGLYLVEVGEIENFVKEVGNHGPNWLVEVFKKYPDLDDDVYDEIKMFLEPLMNF